MAAREIRGSIWAPTIIAHWMDGFHVVSYENNLQARDFVIFTLYYEKWKVENS